MDKRERQATKSGGFPASHCPTPEGADQAPVTPSAPPAEPDKPEASEEAEDQEG